MQRDAIVTLLKSNPFFAHFTPAHLDAFLACGERAIFQKDHKLIEQNKPGDRAYLIVSGRARCETGLFPGNDPMLGAGDFIGLLVMLIETEYRATIICTGEVRAFEFRQSVVQDLIGSDVALSAAFAEIIRQSFSGFAEELKKIQADLDRSLNRVTLEIESDTAKAKTAKKTKRPAKQSKQAGQTKQSGQPKQARQSRQRKKKAG